MQSYCYLSRGEAGFCEKAEPSIVGEKDAIVRAICGERTGTLITNE